MGRHDRHNPERAAAERKARTETGRKIFDASGIAVHVDGVKHLLPTGTQVQRSDDFEESGMPALIITTPAVNGTGIKYVGGLTGHFIKVPAKITSELTIRPYVGRHTTVGYSVYEEKSRDDGGRSSSLTDTGTIWDPTDPQQVRDRLYDGLAQTFDFTPEQDAQMRNALQVTPEPVYEQSWPY